MAELAPLSTSLPYATVEAGKPRTTFGSLVTATMIGALIAISLLYVWGAQIAKEERGGAPPASQMP